MLTLTIDPITLISIVTAINLLYVGALTWLEGGDLAASRYFSAMGVSGAWYSLALGLAFTEWGLAWPPLLQLSQLTSGWFGPLVLLFALHYTGYNPGRRASIAIFLPGLAGTVSIVGVLAISPPNFNAVARDYILGSGIYDIPRIAQGAVWYAPLQYLHTIQLLLNTLLAAAVFLRKAWRDESGRDAREYGMVGMLVLVLLVSIMLTNILPKLGLASWMPRLAPIVPLPFILVMWHFVRQRVETAERLQKQRTMLVSYLPSKALELLADGEIQPREAEAAVLFSDLRGFTSASESVDPHVLIAWINQYFAAMNPEILAEQGMIDKYIGDAVLAVFGASSTLQNPSENAVRAALAMQRALADLNAASPLAGRAMRMGIGIHLGRLVLGSVGSEARRSYTVFGDTVNSASRIESLAKEYDAQVIISDAVYGNLSASLQAQFESVGAVSLRGKDTQIILWRIPQP